MAVNGVGKVISDLGIDTVLLPFFLVFVIVFAVLEKTRIFGENPDKNPKRNLDVMVAFVFAFAFIAYLRLVVAVEHILPYIAVVLVSIVMFGFLLGTMGLKLSSFKKGPVMIILALIVLLVFGFSIGFLDSKSMSAILGYLLHPIAIMALVFLLVVWFLVKEDKKPDPGSEKKGSTGGGGQASVSREDAESAGEGMQPGESKLLKRV